MVVVNFIAVCKETFSVRILESGVKKYTNYCSHWRWLFRCYQTYSRGFILQGSLPGIVNNNIDCYSTANKVQEASSLLIPIACSRCTESTKKACMQMVPSSFAILLAVMLLLIASIALN